MNSSAARHTSQVSGLLVD